MADAVVLGGQDRGLKYGAARSLRQRAVLPEVLLWPRLRARRLGGFKFRRQSPIGRFIVDFICFERRLIIELDGPIHDPEKDALRDSFLKREGFQVMRFENHRIFSDMDAVLAEIQAALEK